MKQVQSDTMEANTAQSIGYKADTERERERERELGLG
jgi:hypothetical protein